MSSSNDDSHEYDQRLVGSDGEKSNDKGDKDNFIVAMAPPAKKAKNHCCVVPRKVQKIVESNKDDYWVYDDDETLYIKMAKLLCNGDPLAVE